jgi:hypothetical protein
MKTPHEQGGHGLPQLLDEFQMRSIIGLLDTYEVDPQRARRQLDRFCEEGALSERQRQAVRILFLLPAADADELLAAACKDEQARRAFLSLRGQ